MSATTTAHAASKYLPKVDRRPGVALCLSGGGFRAALFHLGALRRLNETGVLGKVEAISSVSGGSILSAHLADRIGTWPEPGARVEDWEGRVAEPFRRFAAKNLRTPAIVARALRPWSASAAVEALARRYEADLTRKRLADLPDRPRFVFAATDMAFGVGFTFEKGRVGDAEAGWAAVPPDWTVARAVAASSCFPPIFNPLPVGLAPGAFHGGAAAERAEWEACVRGLRLTDGGNFDNMGVEPVWADYETVVVSDGGATLDLQPDGGLRWRIARYLGIAEDQATTVRKRWLISNFDAGVLQGAYWGIGSATASYGADVTKGYPRDLVDYVISEVRTDLDAFSREEMKVLENHGYLLALAAVQRHLGKVAPDPEAPVSVPHADALDPAYVERHLAQSHERRLLGRW